MSKPSVIIVRKKKRGSHGHHGGAWKVAYADFVTAMMAFFLVLWIVGQGSEVRAGVAGYFRDPGVLEHERSTGILPGRKSGIDPAPTAQPDLPPNESDTASLERSAQRIRELLSQMPEFEVLAGQIEIRATPEGLRIELIDSTAATFFDSGSAVLKPATERILSVIAREISTLDRPVVVEGHTDARPYVRPDGYSNWELSADRANAARRQMERAGLASELLAGVRGYADKQLAHPAVPTDPRNRRVSILVMTNARRAGED